MEFYSKFDANYIMGLLHLNVTTFLKLSLFITPTYKKKLSFFI